MRQPGIPSHAAPARPNEVWRHLKDHQRQIDQLTAMFTRSLTSLPAVMLPSSTTITIPNGSVSASTTVSFPTAFAAAPLVLVSSGLANIDAIANNATTTTFHLRVAESDRTAVTSDTTVTVTWLAIALS